MTASGAAASRGITPAVPRARVLVALVAGAIASLAPCAGADSPNFVVIVADDLGPGDLGCYGSEAIRTPAIDRMASEGVRLTEAYTPAPTCSPARASLLTGRHPLRTGVTRVFIPKEVQGLAAAELTLSELLSAAGYATACVGKWHLGGRKQHRPARHGFDEFFGLLYSHNMVWLRRLRWPRVELFDGNRAVESPADIAGLTERYTRRSLDFIDRHAGRPFFLYLAYTMPHVPLAASAEFAGRSPHGPYGDVVEELDASVGRILARIAERGLDSETYVFFTSDNGPWLGNGSLRGGSTGGLRGSKGTNWEGGLRVPLVAWAPGRLPAGQLREGPVSLLDIFPTVAALAGVGLPDGRQYDGADIAPLLRGQAAAPSRTLYFSHRNEVTAVRSGPWKLHLRERPVDPKGIAGKSRSLASPRLYRLDTDPGERIDIGASHPAVVERLRRGAERFSEGLEPTVRLRPYGRAILRGLLTPLP